MNYFARPDQPLHIHLANVAKLAGMFGQTIGLHREAVLAGSLHDLGKYRSEFQDYLRGDRTSSAETQHAAYGAVWAIERNQLLQAFVIAGHHAGLHDIADLQGIPFKSVLGLPESLETALQRYLTEAAPPRMSSANRNFLPQPRILPNKPSASTLLSACYFHASLMLTDWIRPSGLSRRLKIVCSMLPLCWKQSKTNGSGKPGILLTVS
ncbi:MAG: CRISPR-associated endonuclease Cas3'' [Akkermansiaceae bacterium]